MNTELRKLQAAVYDLECASSDIHDKGLISAVEGVIKSFDALSERLKNENSEGLVKISDVCDFLKEQRDQNTEEAVMAFKGKTQAEHDWYMIEDCIELFESSFAAGDQGSAGDTGHIKQQGNSPKNQ